MIERELERLFIEFLFNKGYNKENLLSQFAIRDESERAIFRPDLVIIDTIDKEYIGLIEFKNRIDRRIEEQTIGQFYKYFGYLGTKNITAYLVTPIENNDFQIFELTTDNSFQPISKDDFPNFKTLSAKRITDEKIKQREIELKKLKELKEKERRARQSAIFSILSLVVGVVASLTAIFFQQKGIIKPKQKVEICCDSLESKILDINQKILNLEKKFLSLTDTVKSKDTIFIAANFSSIEKRIKIIEDGISENPEKTLSILQIRNEIELLKRNDEHIKEITQTRFDAIQNEFNTQNAWMLGVVIAIFGSILAYAIPKLLLKWNSQTD